MPLPDPWREACSIEAMMINTQPYRSKDSKWFTDEDLLPIDRPKEPAPEPAKQEPPEQIDTAKLVHAALTGSY